MKKTFVTLIGLTALAPVWAQDANVLEASASARTAYQDRQALAQIQARAESALQAAEASAKAAREQAEYTKRVASRPPAPAPAAPSSPAARPAAPARPAYSAYYEHVVEAGQTLSFIAKGYDTTVPKILAANPGLSAAKLRVGQKLIIPAEEPQQAAPQKPAPRKRK